MSYGKGLYGISKYGEKIESIEIVENKKPDLMRYLPPIMQQVTDIEVIQDRIAEPMGALYNSIDEWVKQYYVHTATWGLDIWEQEYGLATDKNKGYELRREMILAKIRGNGTTTKDMIKNVAMAFSGGEVEVNEFPQEYRFEIQFIGIKGIPPNMAGLINALDEIKPAHLDFTFKYSYTAWNVLDGLNWNQVKSKTWQELRIYE